MKSKATKSKTAALDDLVNQLYREIQAKVPTRGRKLLSDFILLISKRLKLDPSPEGREHLYQLLDEERKAFTRKKRRSCRR